MEHKNNLKSINYIIIKKYLCYNQIRVFLKIDHLKGWYKIKIQINNNTISGLLILYD